MKKDTAVMAIISKEQDIAATTSMKDMMSMTGTAATIMTGMKDTTAITTIRSMRKDTAAITMMERKVDITAATITRNKMQIISKSEEDTRKAGKSFAETLEKGDVVSLRGSLGAGKTVFAKGIAESLGIEEAIVSPTFTIVQEYDGRIKMYHLDLYRLSGEDEFESMGGEDFLYSDGVALIEWSEKIESMLPESTIYVDISIGDDGNRVINVEGGRHEYSLS